MTSESSKDSASFPFVQVVDEDFKQYWSQHPPLRNPPLVRLVIFQLMVQSVFYTIYSPLIQSISCQFVFNTRTDCVANLTKSKVDIVKCPLFTYRARHLLTESTWAKSTFGNPVLAVSSCLLVLPLPGNPSMRTCFIIFPRHLG